ncbi:hypothetical protein [Brevibacterium yomogidense]|nr:hypothetical protein [Brevibacterium yomogidense]
MDTPSTDQPSSDAAPRRPVRSGLFGPPRRSRAAQFSVVGFGLLLVVSLVITALSDAEVSPGLALTFTGLMFLCGVAELLDSEQVRFAIVLRLTGAAIAALGLVLQLI